jgi:DNA repair exonuclease SbcCD ATPase subunit
MVCKEEQLRSGEWDDEKKEYSNGVLDAVISDISEDIKENEGQKDRASQVVVEIDKEIKDLENSDVIQEIKKLIEEGKDLVKQKKQEEEKKEGNLKGWNRLLSESEKKSESCKRSIKEAKVNIASNEEKLKLQNDIVDRFDKDAHQKKIERCEKASEVKEKYQAMNQQVEEQREEVIKKISSFDAAIQYRSKDLISLQEQIDNAGENNQFVCKECQSWVTKEHTLKKIEDIQEIVGKNTVLRDQLKSKLDKLNEARESVKEKLKKIEQYGVQHQRLLSYEKGVESATEIQKNLQSILEQYGKAFGEKEKESKELDDKILEYKEKCLTIEVESEEKLAEICGFIVLKRSAVAERKEAAKEIESNIAKKQEERKKQKAVIAEIDKKCGKLQEKLDQMIELGKEIAEEEKAIEETRKQLQRYKILESAFGLEGVQTRIVAKYLPLLNMYVKQFLDILSNGKLLVNLYVNDKSKVDMEIVGGTADNYVMLSGGEKMVVRLAVDVGLSLLSFSRTSRTPDMICLDEIFGPLDPEHTKSVFKMLDALKDRFKKVFLISHKSEIQALVENNIIVEKSSGNRGLSKITGIRDITV